MRESNGSVGFIKGEEDSDRSFYSMLGDNAQQLVVESHRSIQTRSLLPYNTNTVRTVIRESHNLAQSISTTAAPFEASQGARPTPGVSAELIVSALALARNKRALYVYHQERIETIKDKFWEKGGVASNAFAQGMETRQNMTTFDEAFAKGYSDLCLQFKTSWYGGSSRRERDEFMEDEEDEEEEDELVQLMDAVDLFGGGTDIAPPKDLMVDVRVTKDMGEVELLSGNRINLEKGKQYFLPREDVEAMVVSGAVELVE
ncbi:DNA replication protein PSF1 [Sporobolomyces salmoneus]|uniref:DNA replication protein PSF1 n=1 Tax=Sporobolomyces salmoneus TaxID=183962 RepID=UPI00316FBD84